LEPCFACAQQGEAAQRLEEKGLPGHAAIVKVIRMNTAARISVLPPAGPQIDCSNVDVCGMIASAGMPSRMRRS